MSMPGQKDDAFSIEAEGHDSEMVCTEFKQFFKAAAPRIHYENLHRKLMDHFGAGFPEPTKFQQHALPVLLRSLRTAAAAPSSPAELLSPRPPKDVPPPP